MSRHRRWGRDSLTGGRGTSLIASVGGFLIVPTAVGMLTTMATKSVTDSKKLAMIFTGAHAAGALASYYGAKKYPGAHSFLRGGMYGEGVVTAFAGIETAMISTAGQTTQAMAPAGSTQQQLMALGDKMVKGGWFK